ncbi:MAG: DUF2752 domain-containing protein [Persicimonas sp.]
MPTGNPSRKVSRHRLIYVAWLGALAGIAVLAFVSTETLEGLPSVCVSRWLFDVKCHGCGMTRAFSSLLEGDFAAAARYNWKVFVVVPLFLAVGAGSVWRHTTEADDD